MFRPREGVQAEDCRPWPGPCKPGHGSGPGVRLIPRPGLGRVPGRTLRALDVDALLDKMAKRYQHEQLTDVDGVKIDFETGWVHMRKSNTEPIIRIYTEASSPEEANGLADRFIGELKELSGL